MTEKPHGSPALFTTETVWNAGLLATGVAGDGQSLLVGREGDWAPEHLLLLAAESCFMSTFLGLASAAGIEVLGYVSNGKLQVSGDGRSPGRVALSTCVVIASGEDAERVSRLADQARRESVVGRTLGSHLNVTLDIRPIPMRPSPFPAFGVTGA